MRARIVAAMTIAALAGPSAAAAQEPYAEKPQYSEVVRDEGTIVDRYGHHLKAYYTYPAVNGKRAPGRFPVVLMLDYTDRSNAPGGAELWGRHGYVQVDVDFPGRSGSDGSGTINADGLGWSGYDVVEQLAAQPWSTGAVGMVGSSGNGLVQLMVAMKKPPHLRSIVPHVAPWDLYRHLFFPGGIRSWAFYGFIAPAYTANPPCADPPANAEELRRTIACLQERLRSGHLISSEMVEIATHTEFDAFWEDRVVRLDQIDVPMWVMGAWDDFFTAASPDMYLGTRNPNRLLAMGVGGHEIGKSIEVGPELLAWHDRWLRGNRNAYIEDQLQSARFRYLLLGTGQWRAAPDYPIPGTRFTRFYLDKTSLSREAVPASPGRLSYAYQPLQGWSSGGYGYLNFTNEEGLDENVVAVPVPGALHALDPTSNADQRLEAAGGPQLLSAPLQEDTEVTGPIRVTFYASSTASDTDWVVHLLDAYPTSGEQPADSRKPPGFRYKVTTGWLSGTHRNSLSRREPIPPGEIVKYTVDLIPTSHMFRKGHRIGIAIRSGDLAWTVPNLNPATNTIHTGPAHPSEITLPIVPACATAFDRRARIPKRVAQEPPEEKCFPPAVTLKRCRSRRAFDIRLPRRVGGRRVVRATVRVGSRRMPVSRHGGRLRARVLLRGRAPGRYAVRIRLTTSDGRRFDQTRRYRTCARR